jgi:hypothetical protein
MLNVLTIRPALTDLYKLIDKVPRYPITSRELTELAAKYRSPKEVVDFYRTFDNNHVYTSKEELAAISEQVDMIRHQEADMPPEIERGPEDY